MPVIGSSGHILPRDGVNSLPSDEIRAEEAMNEGDGVTTVSILYGKSEMHIRLPRDARPTVIGKRPMKKLPDPRGAVRNALAGRIAVPPYEALVRGKRSACILICDITRPVPNHLFLRPLIEGLIAGGVPRERITVLVATGLHRPNEGAELAEVVGDPGVFDTVR